MLVADLGGEKSVDLGPDEVHVYILPTGAPLETTVYPERVERLCPAERARYDRYRFPHKKNEFLFGKMLTRWVLSRYHGRERDAWSFTEAARGKPDACDAGDLRFNLSHTKGLLAVAITRGWEVGVDVEQVERRDSAVADRFFAVDEAAQVRAAPEEAKDRLFARFWTLKEAYIKAHGDGLSIPLASFSFVLADPVRITFREPGGGDPAAWWFAHRDPTPEHALAVAVHTTGSMRVQWFDVALSDL